VFSISVGATQLHLQRVEKDFLAAPVPGCLCRHRRRIYPRLRPLLPARGDPAAHVDGGFPPAVFAYSVRKIGLVVMVRKTSAALSALLVLGYLGTKLLRCRTCCSVSCFRPGRPHARRTPRHNPPAYSPPPPPPPSAFRRGSGAGVRPFQCELPILQPRGPQLQHCHDRDDARRRRDPSTTASLRFSASAALARVAALF